MKKSVAISVEPRCFSDDEVPEGWKLVTILDVCEVNPPKPPKDFLPADAPVTFVPMPAVDADMGAITNPQIKPYLEVRNGFTSFRDGDVIMAKITPCMENGKAAIVHGMKNGIGFGSTEFHVMRSRGEILPEYLFYYIRQKSFRNKAESHFTGSVGQKRVPTDFIKQSVIPLPPLAEQQRIVARVEALLSHVDAAGDRLSRVPSIMKRFRQSVLAAACSGRLTEEWREENPDVEPASQLLERIVQERKKIEKKKNLLPVLCGDSDLPELPETWMWTKWASIGISQNGRLFPSKEYQSEGTRLLRPGNFHDDGIIIWTEKNTRCLPKLYEEKYPDFIIKPKEILMNLTAQSLKEEFLGRVCISGDSDHCLLNQRLARLSPIQIDPLFVLWVFKSPHFRKFVNRLNTGSMIQHMFTSQLAEYDFPLPPLAEQHEIVRRIGLLFERADAIEREVAAAGRRCERLTQAVMVKAFSGML